MKTLFYHDEGISGISIRCDPAPCAFHVHTATTQGDTAFYKSTNSISVWVYIPLAKRERISALWKRPRRAFNRDLGLAFVITGSKNATRVAVAGAEGTRYLSEMEWKLMDAPGSRRGPSRLFYDSHPNGIRQLMFESREPDKPTSCPVLSRPALFSPHTGSDEGFFWSSASLEGVTALRQCRRGNSQGRQEVIGLLFTHADGTVSSVGQVRWDCLGKRSDVAGSDDLWLAFERTASRCPYISDAQLSPSERPGRFRLSWRGRLEWWYSYRQCQIRYDGRTSINLV